MTPKQYFDTLLRTIGNDTLTPGMKNHQIANLLSNINSVQEGLRSDDLENIPYAKLYRHASERSKLPPELIYGITHDKENQSIKYTVVYFIDNLYFIRFKFKINSVDFDIVKNKILSITIKDNTICYVDITNHLFNNQGELPCQFQ